MEASAVEGPVGPRRVAVLGDGVIGTTYGLLLAEAGHDVVHVLRPAARAEAVGSRRLSVLDGRRRPPMRGLREYTVRPCEPGSSVDLVLVSVPDNELAGALSTIDEQEVTGPLLVMTAVWETRRWLADQLAGRPYLLGYPAAGGGTVDGVVTCVVRDHVLLERRGPGRAEVAGLFASTGLAVEAPPDMLEWIWLRVAMDAGVAAVVAAEGDPKDLPGATRAVMDSTDLLHEVVRTVRECVEVAAARGVRLRRYPRELLPFRMPAWPAARLLHRVFRRDVLARTLVELHSEPRHLRDLLVDVEGTRVRLGVSAPLFQQHVSRAVPNLERALEA